MEDVGLIVDIVLALGAATIGEREISVDSALAVLDDAAFYLERGRALSRLRGAAVTRGGVHLGTLEDIVLSPDGEVLELVLDGARHVPFDEDVAVALSAAGRTAA